MFQEFTWEIPPPSWNSVGIIVSIVQCHDHDLPSTRGKNCSMFGNVGVHQAGLQFLFVCKVLIDW